MLNIELDEEAGIAILTPKGELSENDFKTAARIVHCRQRWLGCRRSYTNSMLRKGNDPSTPHAPHFHGMDIPAPSYGSL